MHLLAIHISPSLCRIPGSVDTSEISCMNLSKKERRKGEGEVTKGDVPLSHMHLLLHAHLTHLTHLHILCTPTPDSHPLHVMIGYINIFTCFSTSLCMNYISEVHLTCPLHTTLDTPTSHTYTYSTSLTSRAYALTILWTEGSHPPSHTSHLCGKWFVVSFSRW